MNAVRFPAILFALLWAVGAARGGPLYSEAIKCGDVECGRMDIDKYEEHKNDTLGGVLIGGTFTAKKAKKFHYMQSVLETTRRNWTDGTELRFPTWTRRPAGIRGIHLTTRLLR